VRTYAGVGRGLGKNGLGTHAIQVFHEPRQIFALQARNSASVFFTAKEVAEVLVELWRSSVEVVELF
jgi:hypothetical protein